jgi:hypothetical protein
MSSERDAFVAAVDWVARVSAPYVIDGQLNFPKVDPTQVVFQLNLGVYWLPDDADGKASRTSGQWIFHEGAAAWLLSESERSLAAYQLLEAACADYVFRGKELSPSMRKFNVLHLSGDLAKPKAAKAHLTSMRNVMLFVWTQTVVADFALPISGGGEGGPGMSACDAVATGIERNGHSLTPKALKELWYAQTNGQVAARQTARAIAEATRYARDAGIIPTHLLDRAYHGV